MADARHDGVTLEEIRDRLQVTHRTAQRMAAALEGSFPAIEPTPARSSQGLETADPVPAALSPPLDDSLEALEFAILEAWENDRHRHARTLTRLRHNLLQRKPGPKARVAKTDADCRGPEPVSASPPTTSSAAGS